MSLQINSIKTLARTLRQEIRNINRRYWQEFGGFQTLILVYTGYWPQPDSETNRFLKLLKYFPYLSLSGCILTTIIALYDIAFKLGDHIQFAEGLTVLIILTKATIATSIGIFKINDLVEIVTQGENMCSYVVHSKEREIFCRSRNRARKYTMVVSAAFFTLGLVFCIPPLFEEARRYPTNFDLTLETPYYQIIYFGAIMIGPGCMVIIGIANSIIVSCFVYMNGYLEILQFKLEHGQEIVRNKLSMEVLGQREATSNLGISPGHMNRMRDNLHGDIDEIETISLESDSVPRSCGSFSVRRSNSHEESFNVLVDVTEDGGFNEESMQEAQENVCENQNEAREGDVNLDRRDIQKGMEHHLSECVELHMELLRFISAVQRKADPILCVEIVSGAIAICLAMYVTYTVPLGSVKTFLSGGVLAATLENIFGISWFTSELSALSVKVSDALYFGDWREASPSYKRSMLIIMSRANRPIVITAMGFLRFDLDAFRNMVNSAYSYFKNMRSMHGSN